VAAHLGDFETLEALLPELEEILRRGSELWYLQWAVFESSFEPMARARWDEAESRVQEALAINRRVGDRADEPYFLAGLGSIHRARGNYGTALQVGRQAVERASELDRGWWVAWCEALLGATLLEVFAVDEAIGHLHRGLRAAEQTGTRHYLLRCLGHLAWGYWLLGDRPAALGAAERAEELLAGVRAPPGLAFLHGAPAYLAVAQVRLAAREPVRAEALAGPLVEAAEKAAWAEVVAQGSLLVGQCRGSAGDAKQAEEALSHAQEIAAEAGLLGVEWRAEAALADLLIAEDRVGEARQHLLRARAIVDGLASSIPDETTRERFRQRSFSAAPP